MEDSDSTTIQTNARRRRAMLILLGIALAMVLAGVTLLAKSLTGLVFMGYWLVCLICMFGAMILAVRDVRDIRSQNREQQTGLMEKAFDDVTAEVKEAREKQRASRRK